MPKAGYLKMPKAYPFSCFRRQRQLSLSVCVVVFRHYADNNPELNCNPNARSPFSLFKSDFSMIHLAKAQCQSSKKVIFKTMYLERILLEKLFIIK